jgi:farnesol dehydrogenase
MRILITGATGYLGGRVASELAAAGHEVLALCRSGSVARVPAGVAAVPGDILDGAALRRALTGCAALVHMAAMVQKWARQRDDFDRVNVRGTAAVLEAAAAAGVGRILYTSSVVALGPTAGPPADEETPRRGAASCTDYERTKWLGLQVVRERAAAGQPIVVVYPGVVYGPGASTEGNLLRQMLADHLAGRLRTRLGRGDLRICYAWVGDVARGHLLALERGAAGRSYVLGGENATQDDLFAVLAEITGHPPPRLTVPYWLGEAIGAAMLMAARLTGRPPAVTPGVVATFRHEWAYRSDRAKSELGYTITPLREGMRLTLEALRAGPDGTPAAAPRAPAGRT